MGALSSLTCELNIIQAKNLELKLKGSFFVRCYLSTNNNKSVKLNSQEIYLNSNSNLIWNESFSLECLGSKESIKNLKDQAVVFELRWRRRTRRSAFEKSKLVGRAEVPWKMVFELPNMEMEKWIMLEGSSSGEMKPASLQVGLKVRVPQAMEKKMNSNKRRLKNNNWDECCDHYGGCSCKDYEMFALVAAFEGL
ncbi:hypothetical protein ACFE04_020672 [Oxalis oulophora]